MQYCKYHPLDAATYYCPDCCVHNCDQCIDVDRHSEPRCFHCSTPLDSLGSSNSATPFWRRLPESFRYPLNTETGVFLVIVSFLTSVLGYVPLGFLWVLMVSGAFFKYSMSCLEKTAEGDMNTPDITSAYGGGLSLLFQLFLILTVMAGSVVAAYVYLGPAFGGLLGTFMVIALPAVIINFAITENLLEALNPQSAIRIITSVGLPYGILMAFILIMISSVGAFSSLLGSEPSVWLTIIQSIISNYYTLVIFHIMGYMIFQYQKDFGFYARHSDAGDLYIPSERERLTRKIDVTLKEGQFDQVLDLYSKGLKQYPEDSELFSAAFDFICGIKNQEYIGNICDRYLLHLKAIDRLDKIRSIYTKTLQINPAYIPSEALARHLVAKSCFDCGDFNQACRLLNGLHKQHSHYFDLANAYFLMADTLEQIPGMSNNAIKYRAMAEKMKKNPNIFKEKTEAKDSKPSNTADKSQVTSSATSAPEVSTSTINIPKNIDAEEKTQAQINAERRAKAREQGAVRQAKEQAISLSPMEITPLTEKAPETSSTTNPNVSKKSSTTKKVKKEPLQDIFEQRKNTLNNDEVFDMNETVENPEKESKNGEMSPIEFK